MLRLHWLWHIHPHQSLPCTALLFIYCDKSTHKRFQHVFLGYSFCCLFALLIPVPQVIACNVAPFLWPKCTALLQGHHQGCSQDCPKRVNKGTVLPSICSKNKAPPGLGVGILSLLPKTCLFFSRRSCCCTNTTSAVPGYCQRIHIFQSVHLMSSFFSQTQSKT